MTEHVAQPLAEPNQWFRTSPIAVVFFFVTVARAVINAGWYAIVGVWGAIQAGKAALILPALAVIALLMTAVAIASWWRFRYRLTDDKILLRKGILHREQVTIEFGKVQNVRVLEPIYARPFGLALLEIDTAGSAEREVTLGGIELALARQLRDRIVNDQGAQTAAVTDDARPAPKPLIERSTADIALYGLTHNGLFWVAAIVGGLVSQMDDEAWFSPRQLMAWAQFDTWPIWQIGLLGLLGLCLLPLFSIIGALWRYYNYRLYAAGEVYRRESGLVSKHDESIKRHKIQAATWNQNFVAKWLGRINLKLRQAKAGSAEPGAPGGRKLPFLVPALRPSEAIELTCGLLPQLTHEPPTLSHVDRAQFIKKYLLLGWSWPIVFGHFWLALGLGAWTLWLLPLSITFACTILYLRWRRHGYATAGEYGFVRTGFIGTKTTIFPLFKVQRVELRQSPSQRRRGLAHLTFHLASNSMTVPYVRLADAQTIIDLTLYEIERSQRAWL